MREEKLQSLRFRRNRTERSRVEPRHDHVARRLELRRKVFDDGKLASFNGAYHRPGSLAHKQ
jgi:hypothetical protein